MKFIRTWGWLFGLIATVAAAGIYVYSVQTLTSLATDVLSPANSRSETALTLDTKIYALARTTRELRTEVRASFIKKSTLVRVFEDLENIRKSTGVSLKVLGISESAPAPRKRVRKNNVVEDDAPSEQKVASSEEDVPALPQPKGLGSVTVSLEVRGSRTAVIDTIRLIEMLPVIGNLQSVSVRTRDSGREGAEEWIGNASLYLPTLAESSEEKK
jgi:hypothetical protein